MNPTSGKPTDQPTAIELARAVPPSRRAPPLTSLAAALAASLAAAALAPQTHASEALPVSLAVAPIIPYANSTIAVAKGYFTDAKITMDRKLIFASDVIRSALASGEVEIAAMSLDTVLRAHVAGFGWKILYPAVIYDPKTPDAYLMARADLDLKSPKDLEGKTIAMSAGSIGELGAKAWMRSQGVDLSKIKVVEIPLPQMVGALESKRVDAGHMVYPGVTVAMEKGIGKIVGPDLNSIGGRFLVSTYVAKRSWIDANPEKAARFVAADASGDAVHHRQAGRGTAHHRQGDQARPGARGEILSVALCRFHVGAGFRNPDRDRLPGAREVSGKAIPVPGGGLEIHADGEVIRAAAGRPQLRRQAGFAQQDIRCRRNTSIRPAS